MYEKNTISLMYKTYNMIKTSTYIMKALYRKDRFIKDLPSTDMYRKMLYIDELTNEDIILLEAILQLKQIHGNGFLYAYSLFALHTRLSRRKFERARLSLVEKKIITVEDGGFKQPNRYFLNLKDIYDDLTMLYDLRKLDKVDVPHVMKDIRDWLTA